MPRWPPRAKSSAGPHAPFVVPDDIRQAGTPRATGAAVEKAWQQRFAAYRAAHPELAAEFERRQRGELPADWRRQLQDFVAATIEKPAAIATRSSSQQVLNVLGAAMPEMLGGSADLTGSNNTNSQAVGVGWRPRTMVRQLHSLRRARIRHVRRS